MPNDFVSILRRPPGAPARSPTPTAESNPPIASSVLEGESPPEVEGSGVAQMEEPNPLLSQEAMQRILDADPLHLADQDIDSIIARDREHRRRLAEGTMKKGRRPYAKTVKAAAEGDEGKKPAAKGRRKAAKPQDGGEGST